MTPVEVELKAMEWENAGDHHGAAMLRELQRRLDEALGPVPERRCIEAAARRVRT